MRGQWYVRVHSMLVQDWALIQGSQVVFMDDLGRTTGRSRHDSKSVAIQSLKSQGFQRLTARDRKVVVPPEGRGSVDG